MADFPSAPINGQEYVVNGVTYVWDMQKWTAQSGDAYLPLKGGAMLGPLHLFQDPQVSMEAVNRRFLEYVVGAIVAGVEIWGVFEAVGGTIRWNSNSGQSGNTLPTPAPNIEGRYLINTDEGYVPPAGAPTGHYLPGDWLICTGTSWYQIHVATTLTADEIAVNPAVAGESDVQGALEAMLPRSGGQMTGSLVLAADPVAPYEAATQQYVNLHVRADGDSMTGFLILSGDPVNPPHAATKRYVDDTTAAAAGAFLPLTGGTMTGAITLPGNPINDLEAAPKQYVDALAGGSGLPDAPFDNQTYGREDGAWVTVLPTIGGVMTGQVIMPGDPTVPMEIATKNYVDNEVAAGGGGAGGIPEAPVDGVAYERKNAAWVAAGVAGGGAETDPLSLHLTGGTLTGNLNGTTATFTGELRVNNTVGGSNGNRVSGTANGSLRWSMRLGDSPDMPGNNDNDFCIERYSNNGTYLGTPFGIYRNSGVVEASNGFIVHSADQGWTTLDAVQMGNPTPDGDWTGMYYTGTGGPDWDGEVGYLNCLSWAGSCADASGNFHYGGGTGRAYKTGGGSWTASSDARIKTVQSDYALGLDAVLALRPVVYTYNGNDTQSADVMSRKGKQAADAKPVTAAPYPGSEHAQVAAAQTPFVGLIAQEVEAVMPSMVGTRPGYIDGVATDIKTLDTSELLFALVNAVKDLAAQNAALTERINILEGGA